jgi:hypothetical protein
MTSAAEAFAPLRSALELAGVRFAIGGSWASTAFGDPRFTNDIDILADLNLQNLERFLQNLPSTFLADAEEARKALCLGRPFNVIYIPIALKFDLFPAAAFPLGSQELERAVLLAGNGLSDAPTPFVTAEDILLAKLYWFRTGGEVSEVQWRDIEGIIRGQRETLDREYLETNASRVGVADLLGKALREADPGLEN